MVRLVSVVGDSGSSPRKEIWLWFDCCMLLLAENVLDVDLRGSPACSMGCLGEDSFGLSKVCPTRMFSRGQTDQQSRLKKVSRRDVG